MFFKNVTAFRFSQPFILTAEDLEARLATIPFRHCGQLEPMAVGFAPPLGRHSEQLVHVTEGRLMVCVTREDRILPASVINEQLAAIVENIEESQNRKVGRKERKEIQEKVFQELLPRAFAKSSSTYAYIDPHTGWLMVDASSAGKAEDAVSLIRKAVGSLPVARPTTELSPAVAMTQWMANQDAPEHFVLGEECSLIDLKSGAMVRCTGKDLSSEEIRNHLDTGMQVLQLALTWEDRISFTLDPSLTVRKIKYLEGVMDAVEDIDADDPAQLFDADFHIMTAEVTGLLEDLINAFGGEKKGK